MEEKQVSKQEVKEYEEYSEKKLQELENQAIMKYEKWTKPYRKVYKSVPQQITCQKCGAIYNLRKVHYEGKDYWFCKSCIIEKAKELSRNKV